MLRFFFPTLTLVLAASSLGQNVGTPFCSALPNSTGQTTTLSGSFGTGVGSGLHLEVTNGVPGEFGYVLVGNEATPGISISNGLFCLLGTSTSNMYRFNVAGGAMNSLGVFDSLGIMQNVFGTSQSGTGFDVPLTVPASVPLTITNGDTWYYQYWHRDTPAGMGTSNFSTGLGVSFAYVVPIPGMVQIPAGTFLMGSDADPGPSYQGRAQSNPVHSVTISESFWMGATEVTQLQYQTLMGVNPSTFIGTNLPVEEVSHAQARDYCEELTVQERTAGNLPPGYEYRLPTEAEWEYACRAGTTTEFNVGPGLDCGQAQFWHSLQTGSACNPTGTSPVASYAPNAWGLYDMHGNVWEWCLDSYRFYTADAVTDPFSTGTPSKIIRGGSWYAYSNNCRSAARFTSYIYTSVGFRVVVGRELVSVP